MQLQPQWQRPRDGEGKEQHRRRQLQQHGLVSSTTRIHKHSYPVAIYCTHLGMSQHAHCLSVRKQLALAQNSQQPATTATAPLQDIPAHRQLQSMPLAAIYLLHRCCELAISLSKALGCHTPLGQITDHVLHTAWEHSEHVEPLSKRYPDCKSP